MKKEIFNEMLRTGEFERMFEQNKINELLNSGDLDKKQIDVLIDIGKKLTKKELQRRQKDLARQPGYKEYILMPLIAKVIAEQNRARDPKTGRYIKKDDKPKVSKETQETALGIDSTLSRNAPKEKAVDTGVTTTENTNKDSNVKKSKKKTRKDVFVAPKMQVNKAFYATVVQRASKLKKGDSAANIAAKLFLFLSRVGMDNKKLTKDEENKKMMAGYTDRTAIKEGVKTDKNSDVGFKAALIAAAGIGGMYFIENMDKFTGIKEMQTKLEDFSGNMLKKFKDSEAFKKIESIKENIKNGSIKEDKETILGIEKITESKEIIPTAKKIVPGIIEGEEVMPEKGGKFDIDKYMKATRKRESSGRYGVIGKFGKDSGFAGQNTGFVGAYGMGSQALEDLGFLKAGSSKDRTKGPTAALFDPKSWKSGLSLETFLNDPGMQDEAEKRLIQRQMDFLQKGKFIDENTSGVEIAKQLAVMHHGGPGALIKYKQGIAVKDFALPTDTLKTAAKMEKDYSGENIGSTISTSFTDVKKLISGGFEGIKHHAIENLSTDGTKMEKDSRPLTEKQIVVQPYIDETNTTVYVHDSNGSGSNRSNDTQKERQRLIKNAAERLSTMIPPSLRKQIQQDN